jgi:hypothetical protein
LPVEKRSRHRCVIDLAIAGSKCLVEVHDGGHCGVPIGAERNRLNEPSLLSQPQREQLGDGHRLSRYPRAGAVAATRPDPTVLGNGAATTEPFSLATTLLLAEAGTGSWDRETDRLEPAP